ncbi:hypothetical protein ACLMJK_008720 [Lecanora helva]
MSQNAFLTDIDRLRELPDLWLKAVENLSDDDHRQFGFSQDDKRAALDSLIQTVSSEKDDSIKSQLVIHRSHGKPIVLREVFAKVVNCIDKFKSVGDTVTQYDPAHAALPWAAVRFVLQAAVSEQKIHEGMIEGVAQAADVIARYAWVETLYLHASSKMRTQLESAITRLYVAVLKFLTKARRHYAKNTTQRVLKSITQVDERAVTKYLRAISDEEERVDKIANLIDAQYLREISKVMEQGFSSLSEGVGGLGNQLADLKADLATKDQPTDVKREEVLRWVDAVSTHDNYHTAKNARHRDTCDWIVQLDEFQDWLKIVDKPDLAKVLWLHGKPGSGKTILSARIVEYLFQERPTSFAFYFCFYGAGDKRSCNGIVRGWIAQILKDDDDAFKIAADIYRERDGRTANVNEMWHLFRLLNAYRGTRYFLVDGFDECEKQEQNQPQHSLTDAKTTFLVQMNETISSTGCRVIIVSRPDAEIREQYYLHRGEAGMKGLSWYEYEITLSDTSDDLRIFAAGVMDARISNRDARFRQELATNAADKANGMFLWIKLLYSQLSRTKSPTSLRRIITDTPSGLDQAYERDLQNILDLGDEERERAIAILRWTLYSFRPLTVQELAEALLVEFETEDDGGDGRAVRTSDYLSDQSSESSDSCSAVGHDKCDGSKYLALSDLPEFGKDDAMAHEFVKDCGSLLELHSGEFTSAPQDLTVHFVHFSVQEYLIKALDSDLTELQGPELSDQFHGHEKTAHICLKYLLYDDFRQDQNSTDEQFNQKVEKYAFLEYAGVNWGWHADRCRPFSETTIELSNGLLDPLNHKWLSYSEVVGGKANGSFSRFYKRFKDNYPSPLFYASLWGITETMDFLIEERAQNVNHVGGLYGSPLKAAAAHGFEAATSLLLDKGADIDLESGQHGTAIQTAAALGQVKIAKTLLQHNPNVNIRAGWNNETPLLAAALVSSRRTAEEIVRLLIQAGAELDTTDPGGNTAMHRFAANGATNVLQLLVQNHATLDMQDNEGTTPLMVAVEEGRQSAMEFIVAAGADVHKVDTEGRTALHLARTKPKCMSVLLAHGSKINARDKYGFTLLYWAVQNVEASAVRFLLENGADPKIGDRNGLSPLHTIASNCSDVIVEVLAADVRIILDLLLSYGSDMEARDCKGRTPLHYAASYSILEGARLRFDAAKIAELAFNIQRRNLSVETDYSEEQDLLYIMKRLLQHGADAMARDYRGKTPWDLVGKKLNVGESDTESSSPGESFSEETDDLPDDDESTSAQRFTIPATENG